MNIFHYSKQMSEGKFGYPTFGNFTDKISFIKECPKSSLESTVGDCFSYFDISLDKWRLSVQLDDKRIWFLSIFVKSDGSFEKYSLDKELAADSHYEFKDEMAIRKAIYKPDDFRRDFAVILVDYVKTHSGDELLNMIAPFITARFHFD